MRYIKAVNELLKVNGRTAELEKYWGTETLSATQISNDLTSDDSLSKLLMKDKDFSIIILDRKAVGSVTTTSTTVVVNMY